jgi:GNAT superfamily N-acetyltransferase
MGMQIRPATALDLSGLDEIDGTIVSSQYLHLDRTGEGVELSWKLAERPLREKRSLPNRLGDERQFLVKQIATGADEGIVLIADHVDVPVALLVAQVEPTYATLRVHDLRVDFDQRRQGIGIAMMYQVIAHAREQGLRAVTADSTTDNVPAARFLLKCGFDISGLDAKRFTNHDLVKESVALHWYAALD